VRLEQKTTESRICGLRPPPRGHRDPATCGWNKPLSLVLSPLRGARELAIRVVAVSRWRRSPIRNPQSAIRN
jgi:hypothetical protein